MNNEQKTSLFAKADRAARSARALLDINDTDGACDRAYYAMFDAARAALLHVGADLPRTHSGTATLFIQQLVKPGLLPKHLGRDLNRVEDLRNIADYLLQSVDDENAKDAVSRAEAFVQHIQSYLNEP